MNIEVEKSDLTKIGSTLYEEDGNTHIICDVQTANIEEILLRNVLRCFGQDYKILNAEDFEWENGDIGILFKTNLPFSMIHNQEE